MRTISFVISEKPISQKRHRNTQDHYYNPQEKEKEKLKIVVNSKIQLKEHLLCGPISLDIKFFIQLPKSNASRRNKIDQHTQRPDIDNLLKFILDVMSGLVYADDAYIYKILCSKHFSDFPRTEVIAKEDIPNDINPREIYEPSKKD